MSIGKINYCGIWSLFKKEVLRFAKVYHQTLFAPVINVLLLFSMFSLVVGNNSNIAKGVNFKEFIASGLVIIVAMQNAFANSSSSFVMSKVLGHIIDCLIPPIGVGGIVFAMTMAAILRGILVSIITLVTISIFIDFKFYSIFHVVFFIFFSTMLLGLLGILCGIVARSFDHMSAVTSYLIIPLTFLSGTFYSIKSLPIFWQKVANINPFFYMIDGFRFGVIGHNDSNITLGMLIIIFINITMWSLIYFLIRNGCGIKN